VSTGGTAAAIEKADIPVKKVEELTSFPEMVRNLAEIKLQATIHSLKQLRTSDQSHQENTPASIIPSPFFNVLLCHTEDITMSMPLTTPPLIEDLLDAAQSSLKSGMPLCFEILCFNF
jgi:AICAR transformylase/IMP cyclohydrolase PurH